MTTATGIMSEAARAFLAEKRFATLATVNEDGSPQLTVMWYLVRGDRLVFNTQKGRKKERNLGRDGRVALCVEDGYRYVTVYGTVEIVEDRETAQADIRELTSRYQDAGEAEDFYRRVFAPYDRVSYYVTIDRVDEHGL